MLDHVEIYVNSLEQTRKFYDLLLPALGYVLYQDWEKGFSYKKDRQYIVFVEVEKKYRDYGYNRCRIGLNHLAFSCDTMSERKNILDILEMSQLKTLYEEKDIGVIDRSIFFEDPDRIKIEIVYN